MHSLGPHNQSIAIDDEVFAHVGPFTSTYVRFYTSWPFSGDERIYAVMKMNAFIA